MPDTVPTDPIIEKPDEAPSAAGESTVDHSAEILAELKLLNESLSSRDKRDQDRLKAADSAASESVDSTTAYRERVSVLLDDIASKESLDTIELGDASQSLLTTIATNTEVSSTAPAIDEVSHYADLSIIILVMGILPAYVAYRFVKGIFNMFNHVI